MKQLTHILILCLLAACDNGFSSSSGSSMDWKLFRGDAALSGYTDVRLPDNPALLWSYKSDARTASSPVIGNGTTYWCDKRGCIRGVNLGGDLCFEYDMQTAVEATPMICDSTLYIGRIDGIMTALSLTRRDTLWNYETMGQISASPNLIRFEERTAVLFGSYDNFLYCVDAQSGAEIKSFETGYYLNGAVALHKEYVIFGGCDSWLRIIHAKTGVATDSLLLQAYIPASPAIMGDHCYVGDYYGNIFELILEKGKIVRHKKITAPTGDNSSFVSVPAVTAETVFFLSDDRHLNAVDRKSGTVKWRFLLKGDVGESSPVVCYDKVVVCTKSGIVTILDASGGKPLWEYDAGEQIVGSPAVIKDHFMILTAKGTLLCFGKNKKK